MPFEEELGDEDFEMDMVRGSFGKKPKMSVLNKKRINKHEMDELFLEF